jgi:putative tryptophan/tyrosine transport system substrate-binding protein
LFEVPLINIEGSLAGKWIELLKDMVPQVTRAGLLFNPQTAPYAPYYLEPFERAARSYRLEPVDASVRDADDIDRVIADLGSKSGSALAVMADIFLAIRPNLVRIVASAQRHRVPTVYPYRFMVQAGGLASYGVDGSDLLRRSATYIDRILKGDNPADLPVQLPTKFELAVNLKTAKDLGIDIPPMLLARADEVIE